MCIADSKEYQVVCYQLPKPSWRQELTSLLEEENTTPEVVGSRQWSHHLSFTIEFFTGLHKAISSIYNLPTKTVCSLHCCQPTCWSPEVHQHINLRR